MGQKLALVIISLMVFSHSTHAFVDGCQYMENYSVEVPVDEVSMCLRMQNIQKFSADGACLPCLYASMEEQQDTGFDWNRFAETVAGPAVLLGLGIYSQKQETKRVDRMFDSIDYQNHQCTMRHNEYYDILMERQVGAVMTPEQARDLNAVCNEFSYDGYAGGRGYRNGRYPGSQCYGRYTCSGYSEGFMGSMHGPYYPGGSRYGANHRYRDRGSWGGSSSSDLMALLALGLLGGGGAGASFNLNADLGLGLGGGLLGRGGRGGFHFDGGLRGGGRGRGRGYHGGRGYRSYGDDGLYAGSGYGLDGRADLYYRLGPGALNGRTGFDLDYRLNGGGRHGWDGRWDGGLSYDSGWGIDGRMNPRGRGSGYWDSTGGWDNGSRWQLQMQRERELERQYYEQRRREEAIYSFEDRISASAQYQSDVAMDNLYDNYARTYDDLSIAEQNSDYYYYNRGRTGFDLGFDADFGAHLDWGYSIR